MTALQELVAPVTAGDPPAARELFKTYCLDCHSGANPRAGFALDRLRVRIVACHAGQRG